METRTCVADLSQQTCFTLPPYIYIYIYSNYHSIYPFHTSLAFSAPISNQLKHKADCKRSVLPDSAPDREKNPFVRWRLAHLPSVSRVQRGKRNVSKQTTDVERIHSISLMNSLVKKCPMFVGLTGYLA